MVVRWMVWSLYQTGEGEFVGGITSREEIAWKPIGQQRGEKLCGVKGRGAAGGFVGGGGGGGGGGFWF